MSRLSLVCPHCARQGKLPESVKTMPKRVKCPGCQRDFQPAATGGDEFAVVPEGTEQLKETAKRAATAIGDGLKQTARRAKDYAESDQAKALMEKTRRTAAEVGEKAKVTVTSMQGSGARFLENPIVIGLSLLFCFPIGLFFVWRHSRWSKAVKWSWTGAMASYLIIVSVMAAQARKADKEAFSEADALWQNGDKAAAVAKYRPILTRLLDDEKPLAYGRVIGFDVESGNTGAARKLLGEATGRGVYPSVNITEARTLQAKIEDEKREAKELQAKRDEEEKGKALQLKLEKESRAKSSQKSSKIQENDSDDRTNIDTYRVSKGTFQGSIVIDVPTSLGMEFSDFEWDFINHLHYTVIWHARTGGNPNATRWSAYDSKGVKIKGGNLDFGNRIQSEEPTKGSMWIGDQDKGKIKKIKIE